MEPWKTWTKTCGLPLLFNFEPHPHEKSQLQVQCMFEANQCFFPPIEVSPTNHPNRQVSLKKNTRLACFKVFSTGDSTVWRLVGNRGSAGGIPTLALPGTSSPQHHSPHAGARVPASDESHVLSKRAERPAWVTKMPPGFSLVLHIS